jgi:hypothetical protein
MTDQRRRLDRQGFSVSALLCHPRLGQFASGGGDFFLPAVIEVPKDGLTEFFQSRGWTIFWVLEGKPASAVQQVTDRARKTHGNALVVWRAGTTAYVLVRDNRRLHRKGKRP